ncbi:MAG: CPBP family intramembrane metalloprotease [Pyrinomonadaceae bacterium]|nr:CPBP family intramembrane metalloprotease [Pyrinomonadaceae bacterium]
MNTSTDSIDSNEYAHFDALPPAYSTIDPNNPRWGVAGAFFVWFAALWMLALIPAFAVLVFLYLKNPALSPDQFLRAAVSDPAAVLVQIAAVIPVHLLTLGVAWAVVTQFGKRPFWKQLGWSWSENFGFWSSVGLAVVLLVIGGLLTYLYKGDETDLEQLIASSNAARFTTAFLAAITAPLVEEIVYRGVLYPAAQRVMGMFWAVVVVSLLFTLPHVLQYRQNIAIIAVISAFGFALTIVRARTKRLLPCFVMHAVFNGIQAMALVLDPFVNKANQTGGKQMGAIFYTSFIKFLN